jgi:Flp pilus assembly protein TadG
MSVPLPLGEFMVHRRGISTIYMLISIVALCALCSLAVDLGRVQLAKTELQRCADAAARYGASGLSSNPETARSNALTGAQDNLVDGRHLTLDPTTDVVLLRWRGPGDFDVLDSSTASQANAVRVIAKQTAARGNAVPLMFASLLGFRSCDIHATATAMLTDAPTGFGVVGLDSVSMSGSGQIDSYNSNAGQYSSGTSRANGNIASNGNIRLTGSATVYGKASPGIGGTVTGGTVTGSRAPLTEPLDYEPATAGNAATVNDNAAVAAYVKNGSFSVSGGKTVNFPSGTYYFKDFDASGGSSINANIDGPVTIYVTGDFKLSGNSSAYANKPENLKVIALGSGTRVDLAGTTAIYVSLYAPQSIVNISGNGGLYGQVVGEDIRMAGGATIHYDEAMAGRGKPHVVMVQ